MNDISLSRIRAAGRRAAWSLAGAAVALATLAPARAGESVQVTLSDAQIARLGVTTAAPRVAAQSMLADLPARVVVPPRQLHVVGAPLAGVVAQVAVSPGQTVRRGELLVQLASPGVAELRRGASQAAIQLQLAERTARRDQQLLDEGLIAESRQRASQAALAEARLALAERREALRLAGVESVPQGPKTEGAGARAAEVQGGVAIRAPIDGIVLELMASPSARVEAAAPLARVARVDPLWLEIQLPLRDAARVPSGAVATLSGSGATARVLGAAGEVSGDSQSVTVRAELPNASRALRPGQFVTVALPVDEAAGGGLWRVPSAAIVRLDDRPMVFVREAGAFRGVPVEVRDTVGGDSVVAARLSAQAAVAVGGAAALKAVAMGIGGTGSP